MDPRGCLSAPDLIIKILSQGNTRKEMKLKYEFYEESGVGEYWVVLPESRACFIYVLEGEIPRTAAFSGK